MALLDVTDLSVRLGDPPMEVLSGIGLALEPGSITLLLGSNGSGKSVLLRSVLGLVPASTGEISLDGRSLTRRFDRLHRDCGVVFQNPDQQLFGATVQEDLELGLPDGSSTDPAVLEDMGIGELLHRAPAELSGGQRRRVAIAGAIITNPRILFLDEPFIELDFPSITRLLKRLETMRNFGCAIVVASHESQDIWPLVDQLVILKEGSILYSGNRDGGVSLIVPDNGLRPVPPEASENGIRHVS